MRSHESWHYCPGLVRCWQVELLSTADDPDHSGPSEDLVRVAGIGPKKLDQIREIGVITSIPPIQDRADRLASRKALEDPPRRGSFDPASR